MLTRLNRFVVESGFPVPGSRNVHETLIFLLVHKNVHTQSADSDVY